MPWQALLLNKRKMRERSRFCVGGDAPKEES